MMEKIHSIRKLVLSAMLLCLSLTAGAADSFEVNGLCYEYDKTKQTLTVTLKSGGYSGDIVIPGSVQVPASVNQEKPTWPVVAIRYDAFKGCTELTSVSVPASITAIGKDAFNGCTKLKSVTIPETAPITAINERTFNECIALTGITIPTSVEVIKKAAFAGCSALTGITIPAAVTSIESDAFINCGALQKATYASIASACTMNYTDRNSNPLTWAHHLYVGTQEITNLVIPGTVTEIKENAFRECTSLTSVTIPSSVKTIGSNAFYMTPKTEYALSKVVFESIESLCQTTFGNISSNPLSLVHHLFIKGSQEEVTVLNIPNSITTIPAYVFAGCTEVTTVTIPASVSSIGASAFKDCQNLTYANYPSLDKVRTMEYGDKDANPLSRAQYLMINGESTEEISFDANINADAFNGSIWLKRVIINEGVTEIGANAFKGCTALESVSLPTTLKKIGDEAFNGCKALISLTLPSGLQSVGAKAFRDCQKIKTVTIPQSVTSLGVEAFMYCSQLENAKVLSSNLTTLPKSLFYGCSSLSAVTLPSTLQTIDETAFYGCKALTSFPACANLTTINKQAFSSCTGFKDLTMKDTKITTIGEYAFEKCTNLENVTLPATTAAILSAAFQDCNTLAHVYSYATTAPSAKSNSFGSKIGSITLHVVSSAAKEAYKDVAPWSQFKSIAVMGNRTLKFIVNDDQENVFYTISQEEGTAINIEAIPVPAGIFSGWEGVPSSMPAEDMTFYGYASEQKTIGNLSYHLFPEEKLNGKNLPNRAFVIANLKSKEPYDIENLTINNSVTDNGKTYSIVGIGEGAFKGCSETFSINLPATITEMGVAAFKGCSSLVSFTIPSKVKVLSDSLFYGCESLSSISGLNTVTEVGPAAFHSCKSLEITSLPSSIKKLGRQAFRSCESIKSLEIPATIEEIEPEAFFYCLHLKSVSFDEGFTLSIPQNMFKNCFDLESVTLREGMSNIGEGAFESCNKLTTLVIPEGFKTIGKNAFYGCTQLSNITLPESLEAIGGLAFGQCTNINQLTVNRQEPPSASSTSFDEELKEKNAYLFVPQNATAAYDKAPWNYFSIGSRETKTLTYIVDDGIGTVGEFKRTQEFSIMVGDKISPLDEPQDGDREFSGWEGLPTGNVMPNENVTVTGKFKYEVRYYENEVANGNRLLGDESFWFFYNDEFTTPDDLLFRDKNTYVLEGLPQDGKMPARDIDVVVKYSLSEDEMTDVNTKLNYKIWILDGFAEVMPSPQASGTISIPENVKYNGKDYPVKTIQDKAFWENSHLTGISLPSKLDSIGNQAFRGCRIESIEIPSSVKKLGKEVFLYCGSLSNIKFNGTNITALPDRFFQNCSGLTLIDLPGNLQAIGEGTFNGCTSLKTVDLPASVKAIGDYAFLGCNSIEEVILNATSIAAMPKAEENIFDEAVYQDATLTVAKGINLSSLPMPWYNFSTKSNPESTLANKCATPTITFDKGTIKFACSTSGVTFVSEIKVDDAGKRTDASIELHKSYVIRVYARKEGWKNSDTTEGTIPMDLIGDVNGDGEITAQDASLILQKVAKKITLPSMTGITIVK